MFDLSVSVRRLPVASSPSAVLVTDFKHGSKIVSFAWQIPLGMGLQGSFTAGLLGDPVPASGSTFGDGGEHKEKKQQATRKVPPPLVRERHLESRLDRDLSFRDLRADLFCEIFELLFFQSAVPTSSSWCRYSPGPATFLSICWPQLHPLFALALLISAARDDRRQQQPHRGRAARLRRHRYPFSRFELRNPLLEVRYLITLAMPFYC